MGDSINGGNCSVKVSPWIRLPPECRPKSWRGQFPGSPGEDATPAEMVAAYKAYAESKTDIERQMEEKEKMLEADNDRNPPLSQPMKLKSRGQQPAISKAQESLTVTPSPRQRN